MDPESGAPVNVPSTFSTNNSPTEVLRPATNKGVSTDGRQIDGRSRGDYESEHGLEDVQLEVSAQTISSSPGLNTYRDSNG